MSEQTFEDFNEPETEAPLRSERRSRRRKKSGWPQLEINFDVPLLLGVFALLLFGALMVYSASWDFSLVNYGDPTRMFFQQMRSLVVGLVVGTACCFIHYHFWRKYSVLLMGGTLMALVAVLVYGQVLYGSARAFSAGSYMPGEVAKLVTLIYLSVWLYAKRNELSKVSYGLLPLIIMLGTVAGLIYLQPDISAAATIVFLGGLMFFLAGGSVLQIGLIVGGTAALIPLLMQFSTTARVRITDYVTGLGDPTLANDHILRSYEAFVKGGWFGVGLGQSTAKLTGLPVPPTDSVFAVIGEELGLFGVLLTLGLYALILWRGLVIARRSPDMFGSLLAGGIALWIALEASVNMAVLVGLVPFAGNTLPMISFGGSSLVTNLAALGILMSISRASREQSVEEERTLDATTRGRRSERGWGVSRSRRASRVGQ
ncbi:MAG: cell division protein FtsW [Anaerolineales bacterium]|nr:cell division protein FtsW [Anaerolineales bacterium]MCW5856384.1 cell division protein FtsW [Anaerolineales bacterium]